MPAEALSNFKRRLCLREQVTCLEPNAILATTIIKIRPFRNGWQVHECAGVQPVFVSQEHAIDYASYCA